MKHGVTYMNSTAYQKYKQKKSQVAALKKLALLVFLCILFAFSCSLFTALFVRGLDIEYQMQKDRNDKFLSLSGEKYDSQK